VKKVSGLRFKTVLQVIAAAFLLAATQPLESAPLRVGIHEKPPYAIKNEDGTWSGLSVAVWKNAASVTGVDFVLVEVPYEDLIEGIAANRIDASIGETEVNPHAQKIVDFTQPFLLSSIGVAINNVGWSHAARIALGELASPSIILITGGIFVAMFAVSILIWLVERHHHAGHFQRGITGLGSAIWFSAVTMTTVGYGDKTPTTPIGRVIAIFWMLFGVLLVSGFTATVTASMSASRISGSISSTGDIHQLTCGTLKGSLSEELCRNFGINTFGYETVEEALVALHNKKVEAVVADKNTLRYMKRTLGRKDTPIRFNIADITLRDGFLAIPMRKDHPDFDKINQALLEFTSSPAWQAVINQWLGPSNL
jgi:ABC-type amino acid transport substrate-binding protein